jgi:ankyrin repeat protein
MKDMSEPATELLAAAERADPDAVRRCLQEGADANTVDSRPIIGCKYTPLHYAANADNAELIRLLTAAGATVDARDATGATPLWRACNGGHLSAARELLAAGADPNARNREGYSCLGRVSRPWRELAELLQSYAAVV